MGLGDLFENIRDGFDTAKDKLVDIKDDLAYIVEDFAEHSGICIGDGRIVAEWRQYDSRCSNE